MSTKCLYLCKRSLIHRNHDAQKTEDELGLVPKTFERWYAMHLSQIIAHDLQAQYACDLLQHFLVHLRL